MRRASQDRLDDDLSIFRDDPYDLRMVAAGRLHPRKDRHRPVFAEVQRPRLLQGLVGDQPIQLRYDRRSARAD